MKFLICPATSCQVELAETYDLFESEGGDLYNYCIDFDVETVRIIDSIGRMVPVGTEDLDSIISMLTRINKYVKNTNSCNEYLYEKLIQGATQ